METKIDGKRMEKVRQRCKFMCGIEVEVEGSCGGLYLSWKEYIIVNLRRFSKIHLDVSVKKEY